MEKDPKYVDVMKSIKAEEMLARFRSKEDIYRYLV
jgi:hypothetical protein